MLSMFSPVSMLSPIEYGQHYLALDYKRGCPVSICVFSTFTIIDSGNTDKLYVSQDKIGKEESYAEAN
jgi:hypothetical protein